MSETSSECFVTWSGGTVELEVGWYQEWIFENVYGWTYAGPISGWQLPWGAHVELAVLPYEPAAKERAGIEAHFRDAQTPDGTPRKYYPWEPAP